jgi:hypothetical protein
MTARLPALLAVAALLAACGGSSTPAAPAGSDNSPPGDIPDNQAFVTFTPPGAKFSVKVPEGWSQSTHIRDVRFTDKLNTIELAWGPAGANAKPSRTSHLVRGTPDPVTGKARTNAVERHVFTHHGQRVILTLTAPKGADNVDPWRIVTDSLRWTA